MTTQHALVAYSGSLENRAILLPDAAPHANHHADPGIDWQCPTCKTTLIIAAYPGQYLDLLIRCPSCSTVCETTTRQPGEPLSGTPVVIDVGKYRFSTMIDTDRPVLIVSAAALRDYAIETGSPTWGAADDPPPIVTMDGPGLRQVADDLAGLLGDRYEKLWASDQRGLKAHSPPAQRHRLIELIAFMRSTADALDTHTSQAPAMIEANLLAEVLLLHTAFYRWRNHPAYDELVHELAHETSGHHALMLLGLASYLVDSRNGVGIVYGDDGAGGRIADLWMTPLLGERLDLEIKTPLALRGPLKHPLDSSAARKIVDSQLKKATSGSSGQLKTKSGILAIGAFHLRREDVELLVQAATEALAARREGKSHLAAIAISNVSYQHQTRMTSAGTEETIDLIPTLETRIVAHPGYAGSVSINTDPAMMPSQGPTSLAPKTPATTQSSNTGTKRKVRNARKADRQNRKKGRGRKS